MSETKTEALTQLPSTEVKSKPVAVEDGLVKFDDVNQMHQFCVGLSKSGLVPKDFVNEPGKILAAIQMGRELGFSPMQSLQSIAVINGRPTVWGDGLVAIALASGLCEDIACRIEGGGDTLAAICEVKRKGIATPFTATFSAAQARKAGLWGKQGPWSAYPERMLQNRARAFALRDAFADMLRGIGVREEVMDFADGPAAPKDAKTFAMDVE